MEAIYKQNSRIITPRHLILACADLFNRVKDGRSVDVISRDPPVVPPNGLGKTDPKPIPTGSTEFGRLGEKQQKKLLENLHGINFDTVVVQGLQWLINLTGTPLIRVHELDKRLPDVELIYQPTTKAAKPIGVSQCAQPPRSLWHRLKKLVKEWSENKGVALGSLVVLRGEPWPATETVKSLLAELQQAGVVIILVERQQLAELAAFQTLLTAAVSGELRRNGKPIEVEEYNLWAKTHLTESVLQLFNRIFGTKGTFQKPATPAAPPPVAPPPPPPVVTKKPAAKAALKTKK